MSKIVSLSEAASIAIHAMILVSKSNKYLNVIKITELTGSSKHHVAKVMQQLVKNQYLDSFRGPSGGFILKKKPQEISLLDIYETIEGKIEISICPMKNQVCPLGKCFMNNLTNDMTLKFINYLRDQTLDKYLQDQPPILVH
jgi:Rrf2 family protein